MTSEVRLFVCLAQCLLADPCPVVRALAAGGVCQILSDYMELIPAEVVKAMLCMLLKKLAWDTTSPSVRLAVVKVRTTSPS